MGVFYYKAPENAIFSQNLGHRRAPRHIDICAVELKLERFGVEEGEIDAPFNCQTCLFFKNTIGKWVSVENFCFVRFF